MQAVKAAIEVTPDGIFLVKAENLLKTGQQHQVLIITQNLSPQRRKDCKGNIKKWLLL